ncbi:hypothetical protein D3C72_2310570 [compost metagenome]
MASSGETRSANTCWKNSTPRIAMVKGLISQLTTSVTHRPLGLRPTSFSEAKSMLTIIG